MMRRSSGTARKQRRRDNRRRNSWRRAGNRSRFALDGWSQWLRPQLERLEDRRLLSTTPFPQIANDLNSRLTSVQSQLTTVLDNLHTGTSSIVPFLGNKLGDVSQLVNRFNTQLHDAINNLGNVDNPADSLIQNAVAGALGPSGLGILVDRDANGAGSDDVLVTHPANLGAGGFEVEVRLQAAAVASSATVNFDTGLPGLPFKVTANGTLQVTAGFDYELAFTYNAASGQTALDDTKLLTGMPAPDGSHPLDANHPLAVFVTASFPNGFSAKANVGFLQGSITPLAGQANALNLTVLVDAPSTSPSAKLAGAADANVRLLGNFAGSSNDFPGIDTDFHLHWTFDSANPSANHPDVSYDQVYLNLGKFLSNVVGPIFHDIQTVTEPLEPVLKVMGYPLPGLSDLSHVIGQGDITLWTLGGVAADATGFGPLFQLVEKVSNVINTINSIQVGPTVRMPMGGFDLDNFDLRNVNVSGDLGNLNLPDLTSLDIDPADIEGLGQTFDQIVSSLDVPDEAKDLLRGVTAGLNNGFDIQFPILDNPAAAVFKLLLGQDSDLFTLTADLNVDARGSVATGFTVFGMGVDFGGEIHVDEHFKFAYDTFGLRELVNHLAMGDNSHVVSDITDGFYVADDSHISIAGDVFAAAGVQVGIFGADVGGFVSTGDSGNDPVSITIDDPNHDGKLRFNEFQSNPLQAHGKLTGELGIEVRIGFEALGHFVGVKKRFDIANTVIVDLDPPAPDNPTIPDGPIIASQPDVNGNVELYVGAEANMRQQVNQTDGNENIIIRHVDTQPTGETIEVSIQQFTQIGHFEYWVPQTIYGVKSISGFGDVGDLTINVLPDVTSDVHLEGGLGKAILTYSGSGTAYLKAGDDDSELTGGSGNNILLGGDGDDTMILGSAGNVVGGGAGNNTVVITTPMTQAGLIAGGTDPNASNTVAVVAGPNTTSISATPSGDNFVHLNYQIAGSPPAPEVSLTAFSTLAISAQDRSTTVTVGDLSGAGVNTVLVSEPTSGVTGRNVDLDTKAGGGPTNLSLLPFLHIYPNPNNPLQIITDTAIELANATTGVATYLMGTAGFDQTFIHEHGGSMAVGQLLKDDGTVVFDAATRQAGQIESTTLTTPALAAGNTITSFSNGAGDFVLDAVNYPALVFHGQSSADTITMNVSAPTQPSGTNQVSLDASTLTGTLNVDPQGTASANDSVTISKLGAGGNIAVHGGSTSTAARFGTGRLADIRGSVSVNSAVLTIDNSLAQGTILNSNAPGGSIFTMTGTTFSGWIIPFFPGPSPALSYSGLHGVLTVDAGQGDRFTLDGTPASIASAVFNDATGSRDPVYMVNWTAPLTLNGDFAAYLGERIVAGGAVQRVEQLTGLSNLSITLNFSTILSGGSDVVFDGDLDPVGASYTIDGIGKLHVLNQTVGLSVTINGYRDQDQVEVHVAGGSVHAILTQTGRGTIYVDGSARSGGTHPTAANNITVDARAGADTLDPAGANNSVLHLFDTLYVLDALQQDDLTLNVPTVTTTANTVTADASQLLGTLHINATDPLAGVLSPYGLTTIILSAVNPLLAVFVVGTNPFPGSPNYLTAQTTVDFGTGQLSRIQGDVTVTKAVLAIDDSAAAQASNLILTNTTFNNWVIPGTSLTPALHYTNLYKTLNVNAGAGDRFELDHTPPSIDAIVLNNAAAATQDAIYSTNWTVPITANGNWSMYFGSLLHANGVVDRIKQLIGLAIPVTLNFSGTPTGYVYFDGDADPVGAQYMIDGNGNLHVVNQTVGLNVTINGFRAQDQVYIYMAGGTIAADLTKTGPGTIYADGKSRLTGNHPSAPNSISAQVRAGNTSLDPVSTNDSVLSAFNTFYVLGSMPQDSLSVTAPTHFKVASTLQGFPRYDFGMFPSPGDYVATNQPPCYYTILSLPISPTTDHGDPAILVQNTPANVDYVDTTLEYHWVGSPNHPGLPDTITVGVREFPNNPTPAAIDNNVNLDASQLRGTLSFQVTQPDYNLAEQLVQAFGTFLAGPVTSLGQTTVNLSKVNSQLSVTVNGTTPITSTDLFNLTAYSNAVTDKVVHFAGTKMTVGAGVLANVQGNVTVHNLWLKEVDDRSGTLPGNIGMTGNTLTGWTTAGGGASPTLLFDTLQGDVTLTGSPTDRFAIEGTPATAPKVTVRNLATTGPAPGVYVMGKSVMPLYVTGNLALYVGRRLNADGSVTAVGQVDGVYNWLARYQQTGGAINGTGGPLVFQDFQLVPVAYTNYNLLPGVPLYSYITELYNTNQNPLPVFFDYTGPGQGTLVFDTSSDVYNQGNLGTASFDPFFNYDGVTANANYPGHADLRFLQGDVIYGPNAEVFDYGSQQVTGLASLDKPGSYMVIDNPMTSPFHFIAGANGTNSYQGVYIGAAQGPITVQGGPGTRVEINPQFSAPTTGSLYVYLPYNGSAYPDLGLPGWSSGDVLGYSLLDTIHAPVTVTGGALRVIGGVPLPAGVQPPAIAPSVHLGSNQIIGLAGAPILFSGLADVPFTLPLSRGGYADLETPQLPGLSIELAQNSAVATYVDDTLAGITTNLSTLLSASDAALSAGAISVLKTTGPLVLGQVYGSVPHYWPAAAGLPIGQSLYWSDALSTASVTIGGSSLLPGNLNGDGSADIGDISATMSALTDLSKFQQMHGLSDSAMLALGDLNGDGKFTNTDLQAQLVRLANAGGSIGSHSVASIQGPILLTGDVHTAAPLVTTIDGRADAARPAVVFRGQTYTTPPSGIIASTINQQFSANQFFEEVNGFAPAAIYFGTYYSPYYGMRNLNVYGSDNSTYSVIAAPPTMHLYAGAGSAVVDQSAPIDIVGAWTVQLTAGYYPASPRVIVEEDPARRHPIDLTVNRDPVLTPAGTLHLDSAGGGLLDLSLIAGPYDYWEVLYAGADSHLTVNFGPIVITDTGTAGTTVAAESAQVDVNGTTGPLTIDLVRRSGNSPIHEPVVFGSGNTQASISNVTFVPDASIGGFFVTVNLGDKTEVAGTPITPILFPVLNGLGTFTFMASGLPTGLAISPSSGQISGTIDNSAIRPAPYPVHISATNGFDSAAADFQITVTAGGGAPSGSSTTSFSAAVAPVGTETTDDVARLDSPIAKSDPNDLHIPTSSSRGPIDNVMRLGIMDARDRFFERVEHLRMDSRRKGLAVGSDAANESLLDELWNDLPQVPRTIGP
jgi:hypothetical protein